MDIPEPRGSLSVARQMSLQIKVEPSEGGKGGGGATPTTGSFNPASPSYKVCVVVRDGEQGDGTHMPLPFL